MRQRVWILSLLVVALLLECPANLFAATAEGTLKVGIIGDQTGSSNLNEAYGFLEKGVQKLSEKGVGVTLHVGDLLESSESEEQYRQRFEQASKILDQLPQKRWYLTVGDHDVNPLEYRPGSTDRTRESWFKELYGQRNGKAKETLYYSFDVEGYHFVALNSQETLHVDPRWGDVFLARISDQQFKWLTEDLKQHQQAKGIIVFLHQPLWYNWSGWMRVHHLLRRYPVAVVVAGHFHYDQDEGTLDGIRYVVVGATGGSIKQAHRDAGKVHHATVMTLRGRQVDFDLIPLDSAQPLQLSSRVDMDRVQALDQLLGGLGNFSQRNSVFLKGRELVRSCTSEEPAAIQLGPLGNPLEVPLRVKVEVRGERVKSVSPQFLKGVCQTLFTNQECLLAPGKLIAIANSSTVSTDFCTLCQPDTMSLWEARLIPAEPNPPQPDTSVTLNLRLSFQGEQGELFLERQLSTVVKPCQGSGAGVP
jgi:predicted phosphodiesterase